MNEEKKAMRRHIAQLKRSMAVADAAAASERLFAMLEQSPRFREAHTVLCYYSMPDEVGTHDFVERWRTKKCILLPVVKGDELELRRYTGPQDLQPGERYHIGEPTGEPFTDYASIDLTLVPGVAFDAEGNRLGRGKGYYDRLLKKIHPKCLTIGLAYDFQRLEHINIQSWDVPLDEILTPTQHYRIKAKY